MARRFALVIGNAAYAHASELANPRNDATEVAGVLKELDFNVALGVDLARDQMEDILLRFEGDISDADAALFFFAGHGIQVKGQNYLIPVDAEIKQEIHLRRRTFSLNEILEMMEQRARNTLIFLDACRDNPFVRSYLSTLREEQRARSLIRSGLAGITLEANRSSFIAYATAPDTVAFDGTGLHSPFTQGLLQHIRTPNVSVSDLMIEVRNSVLKETNNRQRPWDQSSMQERFFFKAAGAIPESRTPPAEENRPSLSEESVLNAVALEHWQAVKNTADPGKLRAFLAEFGTAKVSRLARDQLTGLEAAAWARLSANKSVDALRAFLADYPDGANAQAASSELAVALAASQRAEEEKAFAAVKRAQKASEVEAFLATYPRSHLTEDARALRANLVARAEAHKKAMASSDPGELRAFLGSYPKGILADQVRERLRGIEPRRGLSMSRRTLIVGVSALGAFVLLLSLYLAVRAPPVDVTQEIPAAPAPTGKMTERFEPSTKLAPNMAAPTPGTQTTAPDAQRAVLWEEDPTDPNGKRFVGSTVWRTETVTPGPGQPQDLAIRADVEVPERKLTVTLSLRRNTDKSLPASHTIDITLKLPSVAGGISSVPGILMKQSEQARDTPLAGVAVKGGSGFFMIGLSNVDTDKKKNLELLKQDAWFDIPLVYDNGRRAILAIEKGAPGERAFAEAFKAWKE